MTSLPGAGKAAEQTFGELAQKVSEQALVLARQEIGRVQHDVAAKAKGASTGVAMVGGAAVLGALAAGTGTASLVLLLARRTDTSAAALGVTGLYAGAGALLAREGISRLRATAPSLPEQSSAGQAESRPRRAANPAKKAASPAPTDKAAAATRKASATKKAAAATKQAATGAPARKRRATA